MPTPSTPELLAFEDSWSKFTGHRSVKEEAIRRALSITPVRYFQLLDRALDTPEAEVHDPLLVHRLRRLRDRREAEQMRRLAG